ncbi:hypothetical protein HMPREF0765_2670 [Sphingobacterium spiritivorum ATCC 33300]|uniref:Uncharacterized protein n=1 Tax=Sphingobacterium spiritivorum ATCC 33300 TaxID=525372 RepID=C2FZB4_SPHSI|nr:hypothetical protein HMPREF0765_2670 [Sphingobacterium spiritivorum ATCC 33300]
MEIFLYDVFIPDGRFPDLFDKKRRANKSPFSVILFKRVSPG